MGGGDRRLEVVTPRLVVMTPRNHGTAGHRDYTAAADPRVAVEIPPVAGARSYIYDNVYEICNM
jgi:hypothetical protein